MSDQQDADLLVIGCGPVGVMAALRCAQRGLSVIAIDRSTEVYPLPRAIGMDDEVQDLIARAGLIDEFRTYSTQLPGGEFTDGEGNRVVGIELPLGTVGALGHPPMVTFDQPSLERNLRAKAVAAGVDMRLGLEAVALTDLDGGGARVDVRGADVDTSITARWIIAADGAKSTVRSLRSIAMIDQGFDQTWLVVDTLLRDFDLPLPRVARQHCSADRVCTFVPGPGAHRRWEFQLRPGEQREDVLAAESIAQLLAPWGTPDQIEVTRAAVYRFHANVAATFRDGPVFLVGDAAHQMPPFNGQGMCTGMRDAENLSWKLAAVSSGELDATVLDTYDEERRPHAADQVEHAVDAGMLIEAIAHDGAAALESGYGQRPFPKLAGSAFAGDHPAVGAVFPAPLGRPEPFGDGWRVLWAGACGDVPELWRDLGAEVTTDAGDSSPGLLANAQVVVVRPDRYVVAVANDLADVTERIGAWRRGATA